MWVLKGGKPIALGFASLQGGARPSEPFAPRRREACAAADRPRPGKHSKPAQARQSRFVLSFDSSAYAEAELARGGEEKNATVKE